MQHQSAATAPTYVSRPPKTHSRRLTSHNDRIDLHVSSSHQEGRGSRLTGPTKGGRVPTSVTEFADDTAFERYVLDRATPLLPRPQGTSVIELGEANAVGVSVGVRPATVHVGLSDAAGVAGDQLSTDDIRPLLFGAAWKVLDQLCEFALEIAHVAHNGGWRYTNDFKARQAANVRPMPPFHSRPDVWSTIMLIYASTKDLRDSLVHRRLTVDPATSAISGVAAPGQPRPMPLTVDEQSAFCQVAAGAAEAVINGTLPTRQADQLAWALDRLTSHHGQPSFGASPVQGVIPWVVVKASPGSSNDLTLDFANMDNRTRAAVQGVSHYDIEIRLPDGRILTGPLEEAPPGQETFPLANPPAWLRWL
jgi:hypothetical protein